MTLPPPFGSFPKMGGGSKAVWNFSENSSVLVAASAPKVVLQNVGDTLLHPTGIHDPGIDRTFSSHGVTHPLISLILPPSIPTQVYRVHLCDSTLMLCWLSSLFQVVLRNQKGKLSHHLSCCPSEAFCVCQQSRRLRPFPMFAQDRKKLLILISTK